LIAALWIRVSLRTQHLVPDIVVCLVEAVLCSGKQERLRKW